MTTTESRPTHTGGPNDPALDRHREFADGSTPAWMEHAPAHARQSEPPIVRRTAGRSWYRLPPSWPIWFSLAGFPVIWFLGITPLVFPLVTIPMAISLLRRGRLRVPPGFGIWVLFLITVLASAVALNEQAPGTLPPSGTNRYFAYAMRFVDYVAMTVMMLYVGNSSQRRISQRSVMGAMSVLCGWCIVLGALAVAFPRQTFSSPFANLLPAGLVQSDAGGATGVLRLSQVQSVLGYAAPRPAAPFVYTNTWGNALSLLLVWFIVLCYIGGTRRMRMVAVGLLVLSLIPIIYSLDRGLWIGLLLSVAYIVFRLAMRGRIALVTIFAIGAGVLGAVVVASPLSATIQARLSNGNSNQVRTLLATGSLAAVKESPILGYGTTRQTQGSGSSIAVGKSANCSKCGNRNIGSTGQLWLLLIAQGAVGTALYFGFFVRVLWVYRRDRSPIGMGGSLVILLSFFYSLFYVALLIPLCITMLSVALMWRNAEERRQALPGAPPRRGLAAPAP
jgi:hypothetical protein